MLSKVVDSRLACLVAASRDGLILTDSGGAILEFNAAASSMFMLRPEEVMGKNVRTLLRPKMRSTREARMREARRHAAGPGGRQREFSLTRRNGQRFDAELTVHVASDGQNRMYVVIVRDISRRKKAEAELKSIQLMLEEKIRERTAELTRLNAELERKIDELHLAEAELKKLASTDPLTGACNRREFDQRLRLECERVQRYGGSMALVLFDIDYFKRINDTQGHLVGDAVLSALAKRVSQQLRKGDTLARWGGEEFALLLPGLDCGAAVQVAEKLRRLIAGESFDGIVISCSFGVVDTQQASTPVDLTWRADELLYHAKRQGRNRVAGAGSALPAAPTDEAPARLQ